MDFLFRQILDLVYRYMERRSSSMFRDRRKPLRFREILLDYKMSLDCIDEDYWLQEDLPQRLQKRVKSHRKQLKKDPGHRHCIFETEENADQLSVNRERLLTWTVEICNPVEGEKERKESIRDEVKEIILNMVSDFDHSNSRLKHAIYLDRGQSAVTIYELLLDKVFSTLYARLRKNFLDPLFIDDECDLTCGQCPGLWS